MIEKNPEQRLQEKLNNLSTLHFYNKVIRQLNPKAIPYQFVSHVVAYLKNGEEIVIDKGLLIDQNESYCMTVGDSGFLKGEQRIKYVKTYVDMKELSSQVEKDLQDIYKGVF